jgi:hypothetical protein
MLFSVHHNSSMKKVLYLFVVYSDVVNSSDGAVDNRSESPRDLIIEGYPRLDYRVKVKVTLLTCHGKHRVGVDV